MSKAKWMIALSIVLGLAFYFMQIQKGTDYIFDVLQCDDHKLVKIKEVPARKTNDPVALCVDSLGVIITGITKSGLPLMPEVGYIFWDSGDEYVLTRKGVVIIYPKHNISKISATKIKNIEQNIELQEDATRLMIKLLQYEKGQ